ncbi:LysR family transcriptional regulator [Glutamicibacter sp.]|uniref:LysR family transcriptional regulator n=1 Tax=Glutamicibacter sp. TaxID=1931995 RepID=UPI002B46DFCF|nr:LysR family transcriptional regulator [Glutamicibacter sp.]HJX78350.1 LysR family transcriptional regulator [Glutamicibacter sp.]
MDTRLLRYFLAIVEEGSISRAASRLHMTQPPLSAALAQLERDLSVSLVTRNARGIIPTKAGQELTRYANELLGSMDDERHRLQLIEAGGIGDLRLAVVSPFLWGRMPRLLESFAEAAPQVDVTVTSPAPLEVLDAVRTGKADLGVISVTSVDDLSERWGHHLHVHRVGSFPLIAALPSGYSAAQGPFDLTDLDGATWFMVRATLGVDSLPEIITNAWRDHRVRPGRVRVVESVPTAVPLIAAGLGVSLVPEPVRTMPGGGVVLRELKQELPQLQSALIYSRRVEFTAVMKLFLELALETGDTRV